MEWTTKNDARNVGCFEPWMIMTRMPTQPASLWLTKGLSTLSQKSATVVEFGDCRRCLAIFCDSRTFLR